MTVSIHASDIVIRLALTVLAAFAIGYDRGEHGKAAGLRTTLLVCLAASVSMIQVNLLLPTAGRSADSFVMNDLMRLPLGILTGVGFIGAGAIIRRDDLVVGVTTAATLWLVTVIGLCIGGGQIGLGLATTAIGFAVLWGVKLIERGLKRDRRSTLLVVVADAALTESDIRTRLCEGGAAITSSRIEMRGKGATELEFELRDRCYPADTAMPNSIRALSEHSGVEKLGWKMHP